MATSISYARVRMTLCLKASAWVETDSCTGIVLHRVGISRFSLEVLLSKKVFSTAETDFCAASSACLAWLWLPLYSFEYFNENHKCWKSYDHVLVFDDDGRCAFKKNLNKYRKFVHCFHLLCRNSAYSIYMKKHTCVCVRMCVCVCVCVRVYVYIRIDMYIRSRYYSRVSVCIDF